MRAALLLLLLVAGCRCHCPLPDPAGPIDSESWSTDIIPANDPITGGNQTPAPADSDTLILLLRPAGPILKCCRDAERVRLRPAED